MAVTITAGGAGAGGRATVPGIAYALPRTSQTIADTSAESVSTVIGRQGETVIFMPSTDIALAVAVGADPDASVSYQWRVAAGGSLPLYCENGDTRFSVVDLT